MASFSSSSFEASSIISLIVSCLTIYFMFRMVELDPDSGDCLLLTDNQKVCVIAIVSCVSFTISLFTSSIVDLVFLSIFMTSLLINGYIDHKTGTVYRFFSVLSVIIGLCYFILKGILGEITGYQVKSMIIAIVIFSILVLIMQKLKICGTGDAIILISCGFYIPIMTLGSGLFMIEAILIHFIIADVLMIILNITNMNWKKMRLKSDVAYVVDIYMASYIMLVVQTYIPDLYARIFRLE